MDADRLHRGNIFKRLAASRGSEQFEILTRLGDGRVERIVSLGQCSPPDSWYDQDHDEWVLVLRGRARLEVQGLRKPFELGPGDYIDLPAHTRHRVDWTTPDEPTVWLAIHY